MTNLNRGQSRNRLLAEVTQRAASALDDLFKRQKPNQEDMEGLQKLIAEYLSPLANDPVAMIGTATFPTILEAYQHWKGEAAGTINEFGSAMQSLQKRLATAFANGSKIHPNETETLREFCSKLSKLALEAA